MLVSGVCDCSSCSFYHRRNCVLTKNSRKELFQHMEATPKILTRGHKLNTQGLGRPRECLLQSSCIRRLGEWGSVTHSTHASSKGSSFHLAPVKCSPGFKIFNFFKRSHQFQFYVLFPEFDMLTVNLKNFKHTHLWVPPMTSFLYIVIFHLMWSLGKKRIINRIFVSRLVYSHLMDTKISETCFHRKKYLFNNKLEKITHFR